MFINYYYYYSDLVSCSFCLYYIFLETINNIDKFFVISGEFSFICADCLKICNKLLFNNNYYKESYIKIFEDLDIYDEYFYCYVNCVNCFLYFEGYYRYYNYPDFPFCEFEREYFYYVIDYYDYYDFYKYCNRYDCFCCSEYYFFLNYCKCFLSDLKIYRKYYKEFEISYNFYKSEDDFSDLLTPEEIFFFLDKFVIGQEKPKKVISVSIYNHYKRIKLNIDFDIDIPKSNILMIGPSGSGKTFLIKTLSKILNIPIIIVDATTLTETGYVGEDVENIIQRLFNESYYDIEGTEMGIVFIDEIDKISSKNISSNRDISGEGVQQALLKIIESTDCPVFAINEHGEHGFISINTENILFICGGAFPNLDMNFNIEEDDNRFDIFNPEKLIDFGLIPELIGRLPLIIKFKNLDIFFLKRILYSSENSLINYYNNLFISENVEFFISPEAINLISKTASEKCLGSRGLKSILDNILLDIMYKLPNLDSLNKIIIHNNIFEKNNNGPILRYDF